MVFWSVPCVTAKFMLAFTILIPPTNRIWKQPSKLAAVVLSIQYCKRRRRDLLVAPRGVKPEP